MARFGIHEETVWSFETARFRTELRVSPCLEDPDDHFCEEEDVQAVREGRLEWFDARVVVSTIDGAELGWDSLGCCAYVRVSDFHKIGSRDYFGDMVGEAIAHARVGIAQMRGRLDGIKVK